MWRAIVVGLLLVLPIAVFVAVGAYALWEQGSLGWLWWLIPICWGLAWLLGRGWQRHLAPPSVPQFKPPEHWTDQDRAAMRLVEAEQGQVQKISPEKLTDPYFYLDRALELSLQIAKHYHPRSRDPVSSLTVPEILAVAHLAFEDLERWARKYVPVSHLLTLHQWRLLSKAPGWFRTASNITWAISIFLHPVNLGRYVTSRLAMNSARKQIQNNVLAWFYVFFIRYIGFYTIEMNSGRLRGGADHYRRAMLALRKQQDKQGLTMPLDPLADSRYEQVEGAGAGADSTIVNIAVVGQVKAGKSSVINALLGEQLAATDVVPITADVQRYELTLGPGPRQDRLVLMDTAGYADEAQAASIRRETQRALREADLILLVIDATNPARQPDRAFLQSVLDWYEAQPHLRRPPVLAVLTHIDQLRPVMQWDPPYDWRDPVKEKEQNIQKAIAYNTAQFGAQVQAFVPVCSDVGRGRVYGIEQWLLPAMTALLNEARAGALLRTLHREAREKRLEETLDQLRNVGLALLARYAEQLKAQG